VSGKGNGVCAGKVLEKAGAGVGRAGGTEGGFTVLAARPRRPSTFAEVDCGGSITDPRVPTPRSPCAIVCAEGFLGSEVGARGVGVAVIEGFRTGGVGCVCCLSEFF